MSNKVLKPKKASLYEFTQNYSNNINNLLGIFLFFNENKGISAIDLCSILDVN